MPFLTGCFTGIESTKTVNLSRQDRKDVLPTPEEDFFRSVEGTELSDWQPKHPFYAVDNRTALIFEQEGMPVSPDDAALGGAILLFEGTTTQLAPDGRLNTVLLFSNKGVTYRYNTGRTPGDAGSKVLSDQLPMLVDLDMVARANSLLQDRKVWIKSPLWYDEEGNRIPGLKLVPVTIRFISPGTVAFPLRVRFTAPDGSEAWAYMNFGHSGKESRSFANLFSLSDPRLRYPGVSDEMWEAITRSALKTGMTKEEAKLSLGNPNDVDAGRSYSETIDVWQYTDGTVLWFEDGLLTRYRR